MAWQNKGRQTVTYLTINGRVEIDRGLYRRKIWTGRVSDPVYVT